MVAKWCGSRLLAAEDGRRYDRGPIGGGVRVNVLWVEEGPQMLEPNVDGCRAEKGRAVVVAIVARLPVYKAVKSVAS